jgi:hypothetical protein
MSSMICMPRESSTRSSRYHLVPDFEVNDPECAISRAKGDQDQALPDYSYFRRMSAWPWILLSTTLAFVVVWQSFIIRENMEPLVALQDSFDGGFRTEFGKYNAFEAA